MSSSDRIEFDVVGRDSSGSRTFREVASAADAAGDRVEDLGKKARVAGDETEKLGDKAKASGDKTKDSGEAYKGLAAEIEATRGRMRKLAEEIDRTGNMDLAKDIRRQQSELRRLMRIQDLLPGDDDAHQAGESLGQKIIGGIKSGLTSLGGAAGFLPPQAQAALGAGIVGAGVLAVPALGAVIAGAVVGAVGIGGVIGGVKQAAKDPRVQEAGKQTGDEFSQAMTRSAAAFVPATVDALGMVRTEIHTLEPAFKSAFDGASKFLKPLTEGALGFVRNLMPGFQAAIDRAGPVIDELASWGPKLGKLGSDVLGDLATHADEGAAALHKLWAAMDVGVRATSAVVGGLATVSGWLDRIAASQKTGVTGGGTIEDLQRVLHGDFSARAEEVVRHLKMFPPAVTAAGAAAAAAGAAARAAALDYAAWNRELAEITRSNLDARGAATSLAQSIADTTEAVKRGGRAHLDNNGYISDGTQKGRNYNGMLSSLAAAANNAYDKTLLQTGSQELANAAAERGRAKFIELAQKMGMSAPKAAELADQLIRIKDRDVTVTVNTAAALAAAKALQARINSMHARIHIDAEPSGGYGGSYHTGEGYSTGQAEGGRVYGPGTDTSDDVVRRLSNGEYVVRARAARAIGYDTLDALNQADRRPVAVGAGGSSAVGRPGRSGSGVSVDALAVAFRRALSGMVLELDDRTGRTAYLRSRGG